MICIHTHKMAFSFLFFPQFFIYNSVDAFGTISCLLLVGKLTTFIHSCGSFG